MEMTKYPNASFRLGDLADEVFARGENAGRIAKRDLGRYYFLMRRTLQRYSEEEGAFILDAIFRLRAAQLAPRKSSQRRGRPDLVTEYRNILWTIVREADETFSLTEKYNVEPDKLESRLRALHPCEEFAVLDAVERALRLKERDSRKAAVKAGLA